VVKFLGSYYYKRLTQKEFEIMYKQVALEELNVHTEQELADFLAKE
jgi:hypothetical protein